MKRSILLVFAFAFAVTGYSQGIDFGIKGGANFSNVSDATGLENKTGFLAGVFLGLKFNDKVAIQPEVLYSQQGAKFDAGQFDLDYINVPVLVKYYLFQGLNVQVGPQFGFVMNDNYSLEGIQEQVETNDFDLSGVLGAGYDLPLGLRIDARYNFGFTDIFENEKGRNSVFSIALGYSFL